MVVGAEVLQDVGRDDAGPVRQVRTGGTGQGGAQRFVPDPGVAMGFRDPDEDLPRDFAGRRAGNYAKLCKPFDPVGVHRPAAGGDARQLAAADRAAAVAGDGGARG